MQDGERPLVVWARCGFFLKSWGRAALESAGLDVRRCASVPEVLRSLRGPVPASLLLWDLPPGVERRRIARFLDGPGRLADGPPVLLRLPPGGGVKPELFDGQQLIDGLSEDELADRIWETLLAAAPSLICGRRGGRGGRLGSPAVEAQGMSSARGSRSREDAYTRRRTTLLNLRRQVGRPAVGLDSCLGRITAAARSELGITELGVWLREEDGSTLRCLHMESGGSELDSCIDARGRQDGRVLIESLDGAGSLALGDVRGERPLRSLRGTRLLPQEVRSLLVLPLWMGAAEPGGFVLHGHVGEGREWSSSEREFASSIADLLVLAMDRGELCSLRRELSESRQRLATLLRNLPHVVVYETGGGHEFVSPSIELLTGVPPEVFERDRSFFPSLIHPEDTERVQASVREWHARSEPGVLVSEFRVRARDGSWRLVEDHQVQRRPEGGSAYMCGVMIDVTERHHEREAQRALRAQLAQAQKLEAVGTLAGGVAHDFNNLLTAILGNVSLLRADANTQRGARRAAEVIEGAARRGTDLTNKLLNVARKGRRRCEPVCLHACVEELAGLLGRTLDKGIDLNLKLAAPRAVVLGDPAQIQQVVLNLALNARDAMPEGGQLSFETSLVGDPQSGQQLSLVVSDSGPGVPPAIAPRLFEPFFTTKPMGKGAGLGLAMAYGITRDHGGQIRLLPPREQGGARFEVRLPLAEEDVSPIPPRAEGPLRRARGRPRVLVVDDEPMVREITRGLLLHLGYRVTTMAAGAPALELYRRRGARIDLVLLDLSMPTMDGRECLGRLRELDPTVRVLIATGHACDERVRSLLEAGARGLVPKPFGLAELGRAVQEALEA